MPRSPNVIFVITDDQGYGDIACHGNPFLKTPILDQMARESVQLENHHHDPLCSPSRAALLTGQYACRNGVWHVIHGRHLLHPAATTMADIFAANGYRTGMFGKWHLGDNFPFAPHYRGFDEALCHRGGGIGELPDFWGNNYFDDIYFRNGEPQQCYGYCTDVFFDAALNFIRSAARRALLCLSGAERHARAAYRAGRVRRALPGPRHTGGTGQILWHDRQLRREYGRYSSHACGRSESTTIRLSSSPPITVRRLGMIRRPAPASTPDCAAKKAPSTMAGIK